MQSLKAVFFAARLLAQTTGLSLKATATALALKAEIFVGIFFRFFFASDEANLTDEQTLQVTKSFSEDPNFFDVEVLNIGKTVGNDILQDYCDVGYFAEDYIKGPLGEIIFIAAEDLEIDFTKNSSDNGTVDDAPILNLSRPFSDGAESSDLYKVNFLKPLTESPSANDDDFVQFIKNAGDDTAQNYCDQSYFSEDYIEGDRTDLAFFTDNNVVSITKFLTEQTFVTDDLDGEASTEDDQEIAFVKTRTNIASVAEVFSKIVAFIRSFTESPALTDDQTLSVSKAISETPTVTEDVGKVIQFPKSDAGTVADSDVLIAGKNFADNGGIIDSEVLQFTKASSDSGVAADSGSLRSQGYCDFTYFAEDYVGASRTFT